MPSRRRLARHSILARPRERGRGRIAISSRDLSIKQEDSTVTQMPSRSHPKSTTTIAIYSRLTWRLDSPRDRPSNEHGGQKIPGVPGVEGVAYLPEVRKVGRPGERAARLVVAGSCRREHL